MQSRALRILLIGIFSLWFGIIVPGHERGAIRVAGSDSHCAEAAASCNVTSVKPVVEEPSCNQCPKTGKPLHASKSPAKPGPASPVDPSTHCAICKFIGVLDAPVMITFDLPLSYELAILEPMEMQAIASISILSIDRSRGPPVLFI